jgi:hypothetical protein
LDHAGLTADVDRGVFHWQVFDLAQATVHACESRGGGVRLGAVDHLGRHVHADDLAGRTDLSSGEERVEARAAPEVEHAFARSEASDHLRITAA